MKLDKRQFCMAVETYKEMLEEEDELQEALNVGTTWKPGEWISNYYDFLLDLCELEEDPVYGDDLAWFCFETDFGRNAGLNKIFDVETGLTWTIESPEVLYDYITRE